MVNVKPNPVMDSLNAVHSQLEEMSVLMYAGFIGLKERVETVTGRQERLELEMKAQQEFIREQFQAFNMCFPPPPPPPSSRNVISI